MSRRKQKKRPQKAEPPRARPSGRLRRAVLALVCVALLSAALAAGLVLSGLIGGGSGPRKAAIVDQLGLTQPNPDFVASATDILEQAGYAVDYYPGEEVTVDFYRNLPTHDYDLIILRVHSGLVREVNVDSGEKTMTDYVSLFTAEPYDESKYSGVEEIRRLGLGAGRYYEGSPRYFGVGPEFIRSTMRGTFDQATIIMMGCDGLRSDRTAEAFLEKGAKAFVSWSGPVSASHSDAAAPRLLEKSVIEGLPVADAVAQTAAELGRDPSYGAELRVLPEGG
jgi:hypothetical protein